jgi:hypothetical protein
LTHDWDYLHGLHFGGAVPAFSLAGSAIYLDEHGEVAAVAQRVGDRVAIRRKAVRGDLETLAGRGVSDAFNECVRGVLVSLSDSDI